MSEYKALTDDRAGIIMKRYLDLEDERRELRRSYVKKFTKVLSAKRVARYFQLENKLESVIRFDLALTIPLVK